MWAEISILIFTPGGKRRRSGVAEGRVGLFLTVFLFFPLIDNFRFRVTKIKSFHIPFNQLLLMLTYLN